MRRTAPALLTLLLLLILGACADDGATTQTTATAEANTTATPPTTPQTTEPTTEPATPPDASTAEGELAPIEIDEAVGVTGSGFGGGSIEVSGTANVFEATVLLELLDVQGNIIEAPFTTASCGSGCRGDWSHIFGDLEPGTYTVAAFESDPSDGEGNPPYRTEVVVEVPVQ